MLKNLNLASLVLVIWVNCVFSYDIDVLMPRVAPLVKDSYLCYKFKIESDKPVYITEFLPNSKKEIAHHILLFGCETPGRDEEVWNCGEMHSGTDQDNKYKGGSVCSGGKQSIIYAWAMDAPKLTLPEDVAFKVGPGTNAPYIVLQVHYANVENFKEGGTDSSGVTLVAQDEPVPNTAGVYLFSTGGTIKAHTKEYFETACEIKKDIVLHPFAFRTHSHKLGQVTSGYRVRFNKNGGQDWTEIGRRSPQLPQMFYPATNQVPIRKGDVIAARCTMDNTLDRDVSIGPTGDDEMCNFYMMYYVEGDKILDENYCTTSGPPYWYFKSFKTTDGKRLDIDAIPESASEIPVTNEKPVNHEVHNMNHQKEEQHHQKVETPVAEKLQEEEEEEDDEDVEFLNRLEEDLVLRRLINKYLHSH